MNTTQLHLMEKTGTNRRQLLTRAGLMGAAALLGIGIVHTGKENEAQGALPITYTPTGGKKFKVNDNDILNFALSLEYLGAEYYARATTGVGLASQYTGLAASNVTGGVMVPFVTPAIQQFANENAADELGHVVALRAALGKNAVPEAAINFTAAFTSLAIAAGIIPAGETFDPFSSETNFLLGAFVFEDNDVTAYHGGAPYISKPAYLTAASSILAVEAYHASEIRLLITQAGGTAVTNANLISTLRNSLATAADPANPTTDQGVTNSDGTSNIVPADTNSIAFARTFAQVLNIAYGSDTATPTPGGFFPNGINGRIR